MLWTAVAVAAIATGCTGAPSEPEPSPSESTVVQGTAEAIERSGLCDDLLAAPLDDLADNYGFTASTDGGSGPRCHGFLEFVGDDGTEVGINGMSIAVGAKRFETAAEAASAFTAQSDPADSGFQLTLSSGRVAPENVERPDLDGFRAAVAERDAPNQELRALLLKGRVIVDLWVEIDPQRSGTSECTSETASASCAMTLELATEWVESEYAAFLAEVLAKLDE
jgi:hypothetical protein